MPKRTSRKSSKDALLDYLLANVGVIFGSRELQKVAHGAVEFGRRLRELRAEGWQIETHRDDKNLKPGQWVLRSAKKSPAVTFSRGISKEMRARVLERNGFTCQNCGVAAGEPNPNDIKNRKAVLQIGHIVDKSKGGSDEIFNLRAMCSICNEGAQNIKPMPPKQRELLVAIRRANIKDQQAVYEWLKRKLNK